MISVLLAAQAQAGCVCWHFWCEAQQYPLSPLLLSYFPAVSCLPSQRKEHPLHFHFFSLPIPSRETRLNCAHPLCWVWWAPLLWDVSAGEGSWKGRYCVKGGTSPWGGRCCPHWECMHKHVVHAAAACASVPHRDRRRDPEIRIQLPQVPLPGHAFWREFL